MYRRKREVVERLEAGEPGGSQLIKGDADCAK